MKPKGFAWMKIHDPERLKAISQAGGTASQGKGSRWSAAKAKAWASKGGRARWRKQQQKTRGAA